MVQECIIGLAKHCAGRAMERTPSLLTRPRLLRRRLLPNEVASI